MTARVLMVVEDDADIRMLVRHSFAADPAFALDGEATNVDSAIRSAAEWQPDLIVLDHRLEGDMTGLEAAPLLKSAAPSCRIILFTASEELRGPAGDSAAIDAFLLKPQIHRLVHLAKQVLGIGDS